MIIFLFTINEMAVMCNPLVPGSDEPTENYHPTVQPFSSTEIISALVHFLGVISHKVRSHHQSHKPTVH